MCLVEGVVVVAKCMLGHKMAADIKWRVKSNGFPLFVKCLAA